MKTFIYSFGTSLLCLHAHAAVGANKLVSSGLFQNGLVSCSGYSTNVEEVTIPAHCLIGSEPGQIMKHL